MRILIVEDDQNRIEHFKTLFKEHTLDITDSVDEAQKFLLENMYDYDMIMLDHDLGDDVYDNSNDESGYAVACIIEKLEIKTPVIIHTQNPVGAERMYKAVPCGFKIPYPNIRDNHFTWMDVFHAIQYNYDYS